MERKLKKITLIRVFFRSFLILAVCNYERMQNLGFLYIIAPVLKKIYPDKELCIEAYKRHLDFFNVHPYFVTIPAGIVAAMEEEKSPEKSISEIKMVISGPIAAVGDSLFWAAWRPFSAFVIISLMFLSGAIKVTGNIFDVSLVINKFGCAGILLLFLFLYNVPGLFLRYQGLKQGYEKKTGVVELIKRITDIHLIENTHLAGYLLMGFTIIVIFLRDMTMAGRLIFLIALPAMSFLIRKGVPVLALLYIIILISIVVGYL